MTLPALTSLVVTDPKQRGTAGEGHPADGPSLVNKKEARNCRLAGHGRIPAHYFLSVPAPSLSRITDGRGRKSRRYHRHAFRRNHRRPVTSPVVCRGSRICSRPASPRKPSILAEVDRYVVSFGKDTKGKQRLVITDEPTVKRTEEPDSEVAACHRVRRRKRVEKGETIVDGMNPIRMTSSGCSASSALAGYHRQGDPGRLSPAGCENQRQAHRGHHPADAAQG